MVAKASAPSVLSSAAHSHGRPSAPRPRAISTRGGGRDQLPGDKARVEQVERPRPAHAQRDAAQPAEDRRQQRDRRRQHVGRMQPAPCGGGAAPGSRSTPSSPRSGCPARPAARRRATGIRFPRPSWPPCRRTAPRRPPGTAGTAPGCRSAARRCVPRSPCWIVQLCAASSISQAKAVIPCAWNCQVVDGSTDQ